MGPGPALMIWDGPGFLNRHMGRARVIEKCLIPSRARGQPRRVYNGLFEHLENRLQEAEKETVWKHSLCSAIQAGIAKFSEYYAKTADAFGDFYAVAAVLDPTRRFNAYNPSDWTKDERKEYYQKIE